MFTPHMTVCLQADFHATHTARLQTDHTMYTARLQTDHATYTALLQTDLHATYSEAQFAN